MQFHIKLIKDSEVLTIAVIDGNITKVKTWFKENHPELKVIKTSPNNYKAGIFDIKRCR